jgi:hypothetical protein
VPLDATAELSLKHAEPAGEIKSRRRQRQLASPSQLGSPFSDGADRLIGRPS